MSQAAAPRAVRMVVSGRVQGVGFRYFTRGAANELGLVGWVRNLPSGEVEVRAAGAKEILEAFGRRIRQGPPGSRVDGVSESELTATEPWSGFRITY